MRILKTTTAAVLLLFGAAGCADLDVTNPNDPTREQALQSATDVQSLVAGSFNTWYNGTWDWDNTNWVTNAVFQTSTTAANWGNLKGSGIPRQPLPNDPADSDYGVMIEAVWLNSYRALAAVADGIRTLDNNAELVAELNEINPSGEQRLRAFAKAVQGIAHATVAVWYDQGFVVDETIDPNDLQEIGMVPYADVFAAADGYFEDAISLASGASWTLPANWVTRQMTASEFVGALHVWRAQFRAALARTPGELTTADWQAVLDDLDAGPRGVTLTPDWSSIWFNGAYFLWGYPFGWAGQSYFVIGMGDTSGKFQQWLSQPVGQRQPSFGANPSDQPFLIEGPDTRFPQGSTIADQEANPGSHYIIPRPATAFYDVSEHFTRPARGTWRWGWYHYPVSFNYWLGADFDVPSPTAAEVDLLRAEALWNMDAAGNAAQVAALINASRTANGLSAADPAAANDGNSSCVPRLPSGDCGGMLEMLKWEKRLETVATGLFGVGWFFDGRRWGDLYGGTPLQLPVPAGELQILQLPSYTFGGCDQGPPNASPGSNYAYPDECGA